MSQMSNVSNPQFYSPEGSTHQDQFKSAQEKRVTPFDERSITPKSVASAHMDAFNQFQNNTDWTQKPEQQQTAFPNWGQQQETPQSKGKQFGFDDFMPYDENEVQQSDGAGPDSQYEIQKHFGEQQSQPQRKQSRDIGDIEDLMHQNSQNVSQQSQPFQKINEAEKFNYIIPDQLPTDPLERQLVLKAQEIQPPNSHFPFLEGISPMIPSTQQMAFTFHDPNQFSMGIPQETKNQFSMGETKPPIQNQQQFIPSPHFEDIDSLFNQPSQPQRIDINQNLNFHKTNSYPTQPIVPVLEMIQSQKSLKEQLPDPQQVKNQIASSPQLDHLWKFEQIVKQPSSQSNNPFSSAQQQPLDYSPIQSLEMIKQFQQLNMSSSSEKIKQQSLNHSQVNKNDDSELPWETSNKQTAINFLQDQWPNFDVYEPQPKVDSKKNLQNEPIPQPFYFEEPLQKQKSASSLQETSPQFNFPQQIQNKPQFDDVQQPAIQQPDQQFTQAISQPITNTEIKEQTKQTSYAFNQFQFNQESDKSEKSFQSQRSHQSVQSDPQVKKQQQNPPEQKVQRSDDLFSDWVNYQDPENMNKSQQSPKSEPKSEEKEEEFYDVNQFDWEQYQKNQFLTTKSKEDPPQPIKIEQQNQWQDTEEPKKTPRNETSKNGGNSQSGKALQTPTQSPQFQSLNNSQNSQNEKKKNNPFIENAPETQDPKWENIPFFDDQIEINKQLPKPQPPEFKRQSLESIAEQDESMTQSMAIQQKNSALMQENTMTEPKDNSIEESKVIPALKSYDIPSGQKGTHSVRESKDSNKETINAQQIVDQLLPKLGELIQKTSNTDKLSMIDNKVDDLQQRVEGQLSYLVEQMKSKDQKEQEEFGTDDYITQKVQMIEKLVEVYGQKLDSITKLLQEEKEKQEQKKESKVNLSIESQQMKKPVSSPFDLNLDDHPDDSPIDNVINQNVPHSGLKVVQSNIQYNIGPKGFIPFQSQHQTHSRYVNESQMSVESEANLIKYCTNFQFQKQALKGLQEYEIQNYRKQCLAEQTTLLDTYELIVTIISEVYQENEQQGLRIIITFKNKAQYELSNFIVMYNSNKIKDNLQITPQKISSQYLGSGETVRQEILFPCYDPSCAYVNCYIKYTINNFRQGYNFNRMSQTQGAQGMMNSAYSSQLSQSREIGQFRRNFSFQIARPANKFFEYNFHTSEDLKEYEMKCQSEQFYLRSLEELIIFHPWLIQIDQYTLGGKLFIRLPNSEHQFVIKVVSNRNQKCVIQMNEMDMDKKLTEHILTFLTFLFQKLY